MASHAPPHKVPRPGVETLLMDFQRTRRENTPLTQVVLDTLKKTLGPGSAEMALDLPLGKALMRLTQAVQEDGQANDAGAPDYHNTAHFKEAVMAVGHLCALEFEGEAPCPHLVVLAMTAMVGHDFKHDGTSNETGKSLHGKPASRTWTACTSKTRKPLKPSSWARTPPNSTSIAPDTATRVYHHPPLTDCGSSPARPI